VVCKEKNKEVVLDFYSDSHSIVLALINDDNDLYPWAIRSQYFIGTGHDVYSCGYFRLDGTPRIYDFPNSFYDDLKIPREVRRDYFQVPRTTASKDLFESFQGRPYIIVHQNSSTHSLPIVERLRSRGETRLIVDLNENQVDPLTDPEGHPLAQKAIFQPFTSYIDLFQGAQEIHMIDSSVFCFAMHLDLSSVAIKNLYTRPGGDTIDSFGVFQYATV
jgi:hypothetical protein